MSDLFDGHLICKGCGFRSDFLSLQGLSLFGDGKFLFQHTRTRELRYIMVPKQELGIAPDDDDEAIRGKRDLMEEQLRHPEESVVQLEGASRSFRSTAVCPTCGEFLEFGF